uniref:Uncharacterized protein n=1 Tax=Arundo donax TaxID=35708 RepID=A0A0A9D063_ARUDO
MASSFCSSRSYKNSYSSGICGWPCLFIGPQPQEFLHLQPCHAITQGDPNQISPGMVKGHSRDGSDRKKF